VFDSGKRERDGGGKEGGKGKSKYWVGKKDK